MGLTIGTFVLQMATEALLGVDYPAALGMKVNELISGGQLWRLIAPMFLHGSLLHIGFNMYALYAIGPGLERYYGSGRFLTLYLLSGFCGNVFSYMFSAAPSLGASTAIFGLIGAEGVFLYQNRRIFGPLAQRSLVNLILIAVVNLVIGMSPGIDNWGHIGGLIGGTMFAWMAGPRFQLQEGPYRPGLVDQRGAGDAVRAALIVGALFIILAGTKFYLGN
jgi:rhomboid protease GluP